MSDGPVLDDVRLTPGRRLALLMTLLLIALLAGVVLTMDHDTVGLEVVAMERLAETDLDNPVTAVLLNYRSYDTFLEVAVLLLALIGIWAVARTPRVPVKNPNTPVLHAFVRLMMPLMVLMSGYILWVGADAPGGAFQGGAVLGGMGVLWIAAAIWRPGPRFKRLLRPMLVAGMLFFIVVGAGMMLIGGDFLQYPAGQAKTWILLIETAATVSIGMTLVMLFLGGLPTSESPDKAGDKERTL